LIVRDLFVERGRPGCVRRRPLADGGKDRIEKILVLQKRDLELQDLRRLAAGGRGKLGDVIARRADGIAKRRNLVLRRARGSSPRSGERRARGQNRSKRSCRETTAL